MFSLPLDRLSELTSSGSGAWELRPYAEYDTHHPTHAIKLGETQGASVPYLADFKRERNSRQHSPPGHRLGNYVGNFSRPLETHSEWMQWCWKRWNRTGIQPFKSGVAGTVTETVPGTGKGATLHA